MAVNFIFYTLHCCYNIILLTCIQQSRICNFLFNCAVIIWVICLPQAGKLQCFNKICNEHMANLSHAEGFTEWLTNGKMRPNSLDKNRSLPLR